MKYDTETGLPEVPEGEFWRIRPTSVELRRRLPDTEWTTYTHRTLSYGETAERESEVRAPEKPSRWWHLKKISSVTYYRWVRRSLLVDEQYTALLPERPEPQRVVYKHDMMSAPPSNRAYITDKEEALRLAEVIAERVGKNRQMRALLGDYPPRTLNDEG